MYYLFDNAYQNGQSFALHFRGEQNKIDSLLQPFGATYSVSTNFRLELIEPTAREVFIFWTLVEREDCRGRERRGGRT